MMNTRQILSSACWIGITSLLGMLVVLLVPAGIMSFSRYVTLPDWAKSALPAAAVVVGAGYMFLTIIGCAALRKNLKHRITSQPAESGQEAASNQASEGMSRKLGNSQG
jgi:hypothetical protein